MIDKNIVKQILETAKTEKVVEEFVRTTSSIVFIDTEVGVDSQKVQDYGITRAKHNLCIYNDTTFLASQPSIVLSLSMRDVWLDYFRHRKEQVLRLRSGDKLNYAEGYLLNHQGMRIASLSNAMRDRIKELESRNYSVADVEVSYVLAWRPREEKDEVAVCLANIILSK